MDHLTIDNQYHEPTQTPADGPWPYPPAPLGRRLIAFGVDGVIGGLALSLLLGLFLSLSIAFLGAPYWGLDGFESALQGATETTVYLVVAGWLAAVALSGIWFVAYGLLRDGFGRGESWGKRLLGLRVIRTESGLPCSRSASVKRNLPGLALVILASLAGVVLPICGGLPLLLEPLAVVASEERLRIGDHWAGTKVVAAASSRMRS